MQEPLRPTQPPNSKKGNDLPPEPPPCPQPQLEPRKNNCSQCRQNSITGFFKNLLPKDLETADLFIIILLLLMAGDCEEDKNTALLTLALYFFM